MSHKPTVPGVVAGAGCILVIDGFLSLVGACGGGFAAVSALLPDPGAAVGPENPAALSRFLARYVPGYVDAVIAFTSFHALIGLGQLATARGLWRLRRRARRLAILSTLLKLLVVFVTVAYIMFTIAPAQERFFRFHPPVPAGGSGAPGDVDAFTVAWGMSILGVAAVLQLAVAVAVYFLLTSARATAAFVTPEPTVPPPAEEKPAAPAALPADTAFTTRPT
ncbi:MAG: hypothetical protein HY289_16335 [Planctomycetes bacterium]|nr:hypothetical protein [Planctomycetota bacterium]